MLQVPDDQKSYLDEPGSYGEYKGCKDGYDSFFENIGMFGFVHGTPPDGFIGIEMCWAYRSGFKWTGSYRTRVYLMGEFMLS